MHESTLLRHSRDPVMHQRQLTGQKQPHRQLENDVSCTLVFDDEDCDESEHVAKVSDNRTKPSTTTRGASEQDNRTSSHGWSRGSVTDSRAAMRSSSHDVGDHRTPVSASDVIHRGPSVRLSVPENYFSSRKYIDGVSRQASQRYATTAGRVYPVHRVLQPTSRQGPLQRSVGLDFERHWRIEKWLESSAMAMTRNTNYSTTCRDVRSGSQCHVTDTSEPSHNPATGEPTGYNSGQARPDRRQQQQQLQQQLQQQPIDSAPRIRNNNNNDDYYTKAVAANKHSNNEVHQSLSRRRETSNNRDRHAVDSTGSDWSSDVINLAGSTAGSDSYSTDFTPFEFDHQHRSHHHHQQQQQHNNNNARVSSSHVIAEQQQMKSRKRYEQPRVVPQPAAAAAAVDGPFVARIVIKTEDASNTSLKTDEVAFPVASNRGTDVMSDGNNNNSDDYHVKHRDLGALKQHNQQLDTRQQEATHSTHTTAESVNDGGDTSVDVSTTPVVTTSTVTAAMASPVNSSATPTDKTSALTTGSSNATDSNQNLSQQRMKSVPMSTIDKEFMKKYCLEKLIYASSHQVPSRRANKKLVPSLLADAEPDILKSHRVSYPPEVIERVPSDQQTEVDRSKSHRASHPPSTVERVSSQMQIDDKTCHEVEEKRKHASTNSAKDDSVTKSSHTSGGHVTKINVASSGHSKKAAAEGRLQQQLPTQSPGGGSNGTVGYSTELSAGSKYTVKEHQPASRRSSAVSHAPGLTVFITHGPESDKPTPRRSAPVEFPPKDGRFRSLERMPNNVARSQTSSSPGLRAKGLPLQVYNNGLDELSDDRLDAVHDRSRGQFSRGDVARQSKSDFPLFSQGGLTVRVTDSTVNGNVNKRLMAYALASRNGIGHNDTTGRHDQHRNSRHRQNEMLLTGARHAVRTPVAALNRDVSQLSAVTQPWQPAPRQGSRQPTEDDRHQLQIDRHAKRVSSSPRSENSDSTGSHGRQNSRCTNTNTLDFRSNSLSRQRLVDPSLRVEQFNVTMDDTRLHTATDCLELGRARTSAAALDRAKQRVKSPVTPADNQDIVHERVNADESAVKRSSWQRFECSSSSCSSGGKTSKVVKQPSPKSMQRSSSESSSISTASSDQVQRTPYVMLTDDEDNLLLLDSDNDPARPQSHDCLTDADNGSTSSANPSNSLHHNGT